MSLKTRLLGILLATGVVVLPCAAAEDLDAAVSLYKERKLAEAVTALQEVAGEAAENVSDAYYYQVLSLAELERVDEAQQALDKGTEAGLAEDRQLVARGRIAMARKQNKDALGLLDKAEKVNNKNPDVFYFRGLARAATNDYAAASKDLEQAVTLDPTDPYAHYYAGIAYSRIKRPDKMIDHFQTLIKLAPATPEAQKAQSLLRSVR